jgi:hypothetical protein
MKPVYLRLIETAPGKVEAQLKLPIFSSGELAAVQPYFDQGCNALTAPIPRRQTASIVESWLLECTGGLAGHTFGLSGLGGQSPDGVISARFADGGEQTHVLSRTHVEILLSARDQPGTGTALAEYFPIGIAHIWQGLDHLLFVLGLMLIVWRAGAGIGVLVGTVTAFTVAHSLTLAASALGGLSLPSAVVETLIALSILLLATELARAQGRTSTPDTLTFRRPWFVAFVFGLLHGLGFAGALQELGLPEHARLLALLLFNLGVECGQLLFVAGVGLVLLTLRRPLHHWAPRAASAAVWVIGGISAAWFLQRLPGVFGS